MGLHRGRMESISDYELSAMGPLRHASRQSTPEDQLSRRKAVRWIASNARDASDAALLLDILGLDPNDGKEG